MKRSIIGAIVGALLIFIWQTLSWTMLELHRPAQDYAAKQDTIMNFLGTHLEKEGGYLMPAVPKGTSFDEAVKKGESMQGKPWATIQYHSAFKMSMNDMYVDMLESFLSSVLMVWFACWVIAKWHKKTFGTIFTACLFIGLIVFINQPFNSFVWYKIFDVKAHLVDSLVSWGLCGIWLGWWMRRGN